MSWDEDDGKIRSHRSISKNPKDLAMRLRTPAQRKAVDYVATVLRHVDYFTYYRDEKSRPAALPTPDYTSHLDSIFGGKEDTVSEALLTKFVSVCVNHDKCAINCLSWLPDARRVLTGAQTGEFTLWNGLSFHFESIQLAHEYPQSIDEKPSVATESTVGVAVRCMKWAHGDNWLISGDDAGVIKIWQPTLSNVRAFKAHRDPVRALTFAPSDLKFASCSDDQSISVWDFETAQEELNLKGHGHDVKSVDWHPYKCLLLSGSKDNLMKLWDPRTGQAHTSIHAHKNTVTKVKWNSNGYWFLSASRDQLIRMWDLRMLKEMQSFRGHRREITALDWHPIAERVFASGDYAGHLSYWAAGEEGCQAEALGAHEGAITDLAWHPMGHILASSSVDYSVRFWTRNRPGDEMTDKYNVNQLPETAKLEALTSLAEAFRNNPSSTMATKGPGFGKMPPALENFDLEVAQAQLQQQRSLSQQSSSTSLPPAESLSAILSNPSFFSSSSMAPVADGFPFPEISSSSISSLVAHLEQQKYKQQEAAAAATTSSSSSYSRHQERYSDRDRDRDRNRGQKRKDVYRDDNDRQYKSQRR